MQNSGLWQPPRTDLVEASPVHTPLLAAMAEHLPPQPYAVLCSDRPATQGGQHGYTVVSTRRETGKARAYAIEK
jgi:hypothetical protein